MLLDFHESPNLIVTFSLLAHNGEPQILGKLFTISSKQLRWISDTSNDQGI